VCPSLASLSLPDPFTEPNSTNSIKNLLLDYSVPFVDLSGCQNLLSCTIINPQLEDIQFTFSCGISELRLRCARLQNLDLTRLQELSDLNICSDELVQLELNFKWKLKTLAIECKSLSFLRLQRCPMLEDLEIRCPSLALFDFSNHKPITKTVIRLMQHHLQSFILSHLANFQVDIQDFTKKSTLISMDLNTCVGLGDHQFRKLMQNLNMKNVTKMDLAYAGISDETLLELPSFCPKLENLNIAGFSLNPTTLSQMLGKLANIRFLYVNATLFPVDHVRVLNTVFPSLHVVYLPTEV